MMLIPLGIGFFISSIAVFENYRQKVVQMNGLTVVSDMFIDFGNLIHNLQTERGNASLYYAKNMSLDELKKYRAESVDNLLIKSKKTSMILPFNVNDLKKLNARFVQLEILRKKIDEGQISAIEAELEFSQMIQTLIVTEGVAARFYSGNGLELRLINLSLVEVLKEAIGKTRSAYAAVFAKDTAVSSQDLSKVEALRASITAAASSPALELVPELHVKTQEILMSAGWRELEGSMNNVMAKAATGIYGIDSQNFYKEVTYIIEKFNDILKSERQLILDDAKSEHRKAKLLLLSVLIGLVTFTIAIAIFSYRTTHDVISRVDGILIGLTDGGNVVASAAGEIHKSSTALAANVSEQAAALQETVSSLDEISAMIATSTDNAWQSQEVAKAGHVSAENGRQAVREMIKAIGEISESNAEINMQVEYSNKQLGDIVKVIAGIGDKTKVINDIVFQTKLLSFNASVEAARAGEHGKGFAVVAEEIGNLAQMSGNAAKEINEMLTASIKSVEGIARETKENVESLIVSSKEKVRAGSDVANRCGQSLDAIVENVNEINRMIAEIARASKEQSQGVQGIHLAMSQLDQVTQQNSVVVQSTSNATEKLNSQSQSLREVVQNLYTTIRGEKNTEQSLES